MNHGSSLFNHTHSHTTHTRRMTHISWPVRRARFTISLSRSLVSQLAPLCLSTSCSADARFGWKCAHVHLLDASVQVSCFEHNAQRTRVGPDGHAGFSLFFLSDVAQLLESIPLFNYASISLHYPTKTGITNASQDFCPTTKGVGLSLGF